MSDDNAIKSDAGWRTARDAARDQVIPPRAIDAVLPAPLEPSMPTAPATPTVPARARPAQPPDAAALNELWTAAPSSPPRGVRGLLARILRRILAPFLDTQVAFNSRQVQYDNHLLEYIDARLGETHRHYDQVLGMHGQHIEDINARHKILQEELVRHVHDLVRRIDLVLAESERSRVSLESALRDVRARLAQLEARLK